MVENKRSFCDTYKLHETQIPVPITRLIRTQQCCHLHIVYDSFLHIVTAEMSSFPQSLTDLLSGPEHKGLLTYCSNP
jgi:hypothetical protein